MVVASGFAGGLLGAGVLEVHFGVVDLGCASGACWRSLECEDMSSGARVRSFWRRVGVSFARMRSFTGSLVAVSE